MDRRDVRRRFLGRVVVLLLAVSLAPPAFVAAGEKSDEEEKLEDLNELTDRLNRLASNPDLSEEQLPEDRQPVLAWHLDVEQERLEPLVHEEAPGLGPVGGGLDGVALVGQESAEIVAGPIVVLGNEDSQPGAHAPPRRTGRRMVNVVPPISVSNESDPPW